MASYNQIIKILEDFAGAHFIIKSFGNGHPSELVENSQFLDLEYPIMWADDLPNTVSTGKDSYKFRMYFLGQVATLKEKTASTLKESNINEVRSDQKQNALDLISYLVQQTTFPDLTTDRTITLTPITEEFNDTLTGWYFDLTINDAFRFSSCSIPMAGITPPPSVVCEDGTVNIKDSNGNTLYVKIVSSGGAVVQTIQDGTNTLNGSSIAGISAEGTKSITLKDNLGATINPVILVNTKTNLELQISSSSTPINTSSLYKSGQEIFGVTGDDGDLQRGRGVDWLTLDHNNPYGNAERFTDTLGTQIYANDWVIDWKNDDQVSELVIGYYRISQNNGISFITQMSNGASGMTIGGFNDVYIANKPELESIVKNEKIVIPFSYPPFNMSGASILSTTVSQNAGTYQYIHSNGSWTRTPGTNTTIEWIGIRFFTRTELNL